MSYRRSIIAISTLGAALLLGCTSTEEVDPIATTAPEATVAPEEDSGEPEAMEESDTSAEEDWTPTEESVWTLSYDPVEMTTSEACPESIYINFYGMVAIAPTEDGLAWESQMATYSLERTDVNHYAGAGETIVEGYTLTLDVSFTGDTTLTVTFTLTEDENPDCIHTYEYGGEFSW